MVRLTTDDRCAGLDAPPATEGGPWRSFRPDKEGVITLPDELAGYGRRAAREAPMFHLYQRGYPGFDAADLRARYAAWEQRQAKDERRG